MSKMKSILTKYIKSKTIQTSYTIVSILLFLWWTTTTSYFAFTTPINDPPDEIYHLKLSEQYEPLSTIIAKDTPQTISIGIISKTPNLYHLLQGKILNLTSNHNYILRLINFILGIFFFYISKKTIDQHVSSYFTRIIYLYIISNITMLQYLFGAISYDNFINLIAVYSFYLFYQVINQKYYYSLTKLIIFSLVAILAKPTYFPLFLIQISVIFTYLFRQKLVFKYTKQLFSQKRSLILIISLSSVIFYFYGSNLIKYGTISPSCTNLYTQTFCNNDPSVILNNEIYLQTKINPSFSNIYSYFTSWIHLMTERTFGIFSYTSLLAHPEWISFLTLTIIFSTIIIFKLITNRYDYYLFFISITYSLILFLKNYNGYLETGITHVAVQGRYLFPIIFPTYYLFTKYLTTILKKNIFFKLLILTLLIYSFSYYGFFYIVKVQDYLKFLKIS